MKLLLAIILFIGCNIEDNTVSINATPPRNSDNTKRDPIEDPIESDSQINDNSSVDTSSSDISSSSISSLTFTPKGGSLGDELSLNDKIALLVNVDNTSGTEVSGELTLSGSDASKLELINVSGFTQKGDGLTYTIAANSNAKLLVVRKSNFSDSLVATIQDNAEDVANITTTDLGINILYWFNPKDITFSNVNDSDSSGDLSNGDTLNTLPDRSGNNRVLTKDNSNNLAIYISKGQNGHVNIDMNSWFNSSWYGTYYIYNSLSNLPINSGDDIIFAISLSLDNSTTRQNFMIFDPTYNGGKYTDIHGIDINTHQTAGQKHGAYLAGVSYDVSSTSSLSAQNIMLFLDDTFDGNSILTNTSYYVNNIAYSLNPRATSVYSNGNFKTAIEIAKIIRLNFNAKIYESIIVYKSDISEEQRLDLNCYLALKNNINSASCM